MSDFFKKVHARDGKPKTCKFCHSAVWWHELENRWYDVGGLTLHVESCERRREFYKSEALNAAESRRHKS